MRCSTVWFVATLLCGACEEPGGGGGGGGGGSTEDATPADAATDVATADVATDLGPGGADADGGPEDARVVADDVPGADADADAGPVVEDTGGPVGCPLLPGAGEPHWCMDLVPRFNDKQWRDLDGDEEDDFWGLREYRLNRQMLVTQNPELPAVMRRDGFPADCHFALLVPHGGGIEPGTEQLARAVLMRLPHEVADKVGLWVLGGRNEVNNLCSSCEPESCADDCHHVRSTAIDPECAGDTTRRLALTLRNCPTGIVLHGQDYSDADFRRILVVGGGNRELRETVLSRLRQEAGAGHFEMGFQVLDAEAIPSDHPAAGLRGLHPCNVANRFGAGLDAGGVQLELPATVREAQGGLTSDPGSPLYFHRHETQTLLGDSARLADVLAELVCEQVGGGDACGR